MNRIEVLRLLTVLLSKSMYTTPTQIISKEDRWLTYMITKTEKKIVLAFLCSMINISCKYNPLGWTVVPYNHIMFSDPRELLVGHCLRILLIILDYRLPLTRNTSSTDVIVEKMEDLNLSSKLNDGQVESSDNVYRYYLSKLHRAQDFQFLIDGIYRILDNPMQVNLVQNVEIFIHFLIDTDIEQLHTWFIKKSSISCGNVDALLETIRDKHQV